MKKSSKWIVAALLAVLSLGNMQAQDSATVAQRPTSWTLRNCIDWAKQQNLTVRRNRISAGQAQIDLKDAKSAWLPTVSFSTNQNVTNRPFQESQSVVNGSTVVKTSHKTSYTGNYGLQASMPLYDGGQTKNNIKLQEINSQIADLTVEQSELNIEEQITQLYVQILYAKETIKQDEAQIALSEEQVKRAQVMCETGLLNKVEVSQLQSQLATDKYQKVADETTLSDYKLQLKQLLEIDGDEDFDIASENVDGDVLAPLPTKNDVFAAAVANRPEIKAQKLAMDRSDVNVKIAKAGMLPSVSLNAGVSTLGMSSNGNMFDQFKDQWANAIGVTVSIPIFDHSKTKNAVARARLDKESSYLQLLEQQKKLWKTIETYWLQANSAQQRYVAAKENSDYAKKSYDLTSEQFKEGLKNIVELTTDKTNYITSLQKVTQAKYTELLNAAMLKYYKGETIEL